MATLVKSYERVRKHGEVYTPASVVKLALDPDDAYLSDLDLTVLEPAVGTGNYLYNILERRCRGYSVSGDLSQTFNVFRACSSLYGVDILEDNCEECRIRLYQYVMPFCNPKYLKWLAIIINNNIICSDFLQPTYGHYIFEWDIKQTEDNIIIHYIKYSFYDWVEYQDKALPVFRGVLDEVYTPA